MSSTSVTEETEFSKERRLVRQDALSTEDAGTQARKYHSEENQKVEKNNQLFSRSLQDTNVKTNTKRAFVLLRDKSYSLIDVDAFLCSHQSEYKRSHNRKRLEFKSSTEDSTRKESKKWMVIFVFVLLTLGILILMSIYDFDDYSGFIDDEDEVHPKTEELIIN